MARETVIYIHGVSRSLEGRRHDEYRRLHDGIRTFNPAFPESYLGIEWGWNSGTEPKPRGHELLTDAQRQLGARAVAAVGDVREFTLNPARAILNGMRPLLMFGFADMFYYVSNDGKNDVRRAVARQIIDHLEPAADDLISLTLIGHSAGSVVAFDLLFHLFYVPPDKRTPAERSRATVPADAVPPEAARPHVFLRPLQTTRPAEARRTAAALQTLRRLARQDRLRIRRLITLGSPISLMAFRSNALLAILARGGRVDSALHGLARAPQGFGDDLQNPRWINIWDKDDLVAWPVEPMMTGGGLIVKDEYVDVSDSVGGAHDAYWDSPRVHRLIAQRW
jgi:hypothetical protein